MRGAHLMTLALIAMVNSTAASQGPDAELGVSGYVLTPEGLPVAGGTVTLRGGAADSTTNITSTGQFRIVPHMPGLQDLFVSVPGLMMHQVKVVVPLSKTFMLSPIRLAPAPYLHVRFVSPSGEPVVAPYVHRQSFDSGAMRIWEPPGATRGVEAGPDGTTIIGPLPRGVTTLVVDAAFLARTRLPDVRVTGEATVLDGGTVTLEPGASLNVDVEDASGEPVAHHEVVLEESGMFSPVTIPPERTNAHGRVTFARLSSGRYRLRTQSVRLCVSHPITIVRSVDVPGSGSVRVRLVIDGTATLKLTSGGLPLSGKRVMLAAESPPPPRPAWYRDRPGAPPLFHPRFGFFGAAGCSGVSDHAGVVQLPSIPPGPGLLTVNLSNARWIRRVNVPARGRDIPIDIPQGFMPVRVVSDDTGEPVSGATLTWASSGVRVEGSTSVAGDALLDGVAPRGGSLTIEARGYRPLREPLAVPPDVLHETRLQPTRDQGVRARVVTDNGHPIRNAVVELIPDDPMEIGYAATTNAEGRVWFFDAGAGPIRMIARANGYGVATVHVRADASDEVTLSLSRAHRIVVTVDATLGEGPHVFRLADERGVAVDDLLDARSARRLDRAGQVSLGPVSPGTYVVEVYTRQVRRQQRIEVRNGNATLVIR